MSAPTADRPTSRERIVARELIAGASQKDALIAGGFNPASRSTDSVIQSSGMRDAFREAMRANGLTDEHLASALFDATNANKVSRATFEGQFTDERVDPDHTERRRAVELAARLLDLEPPQSKDVPVAVQVNVTFVGE